MPGLKRAARLFSAAGIALMAGACSMAAKFGVPGAGSTSSAGASGVDVKTDSVDLISALSTGAVTGEDIIAASEATAALLSRGKGGPWENPQTGVRGTITPIAAAYRDNGAECRDFLASYVHDKAEAWMQGEACHTGAGRWEVRSLKPWRR